MSARVVNKTELILNHLKEFKTITTLQAYQLYGVTGLPVYILRLRRDYYIETEMHKGMDRYGNQTTYAIYHYKGAK